MTILLSDRDRQGVAPNRQRKCPFHCHFQVDSIVHAREVVRDAAVAVVGEEDRLRFPRIRAQWPAMTKNNRLSRTPIFVINLCTVFGRDRAYLFCLLLSK